MSAALAALVGEDLGGAMPAAAAAEPIALGAGLLPIAESLLSALPSLSCCFSSGFAAVAGGSCIRAAAAAAASLQRTGGRTAPVVGP